MLQGVKSPNLSAPKPFQCSPAKQLRRFLQAYWLRPENALWMALRSEVLSPYEPQHPSIDLACGDGVFSFLHCGGEFDPAFDVFTCVDRLDRVRDEHSDIFDCDGDQYRPAIQCHPPDTLDVGTDLKTNLLTKARRLDLYDRLVRHDNNQALPFEADSFQTVYCNAAYWVENIDGFLTEIGRITRPGGRIILQVKLDSMARYTLEAHRHLLGDRFLDIIGRGRIETWPTLADRRTWERRFISAGLDVQIATPFVTRTHAHLWDVGLRPIAPLLVRMANALTPSTRADIKRDWVDLLTSLLEPLCKPTLDLFDQPDEPAEIQYVLKPR
ncbi:MAG: methyltransferase domain-containing protein [Planctomycetes bacterium]|nr:methyltransferase domain-containing protein [Planctomycetota bacterium]